MALRSHVNVCVIYSTLPVGLIVGEFDILCILKENPEVLWEKTAETAGISKRYYDEYFHGRETACAIKIGDVRTYKTPIAPKTISKQFSPPQSYMYIKNDTGNEWLKPDQFEMFSSL
ncbi:hypothetical protein [Methylobacterium sp. WCS2018Hpa-22]|uniref:hypothetical protein n=1 Tax=Methylobacterium sp. WCS2018Hpa-22 TaxID=3073633 RepID=UPI00288B2251|nr:hypothetical protein [Methylobacterium sp. WCS2018Hpa-22]